MNDIKSNLNAKVEKAFEERLPAAAGLRAAYLKAAQDIVEAIWYKKILACKANMDMTTVFSRVRHSQRTKLIDCWMRRLQKRS